MTHSSDVALSRLPARVKQARQAKGLSLDAVAKLSGVSRSMVSQIERGESSPTVATLWNLTRALQVDFAALLDDQPKGPQIEIVRAEAVPVIEYRGSGCAIRILSPPEDAGVHEVYELRISAGGMLDSEPHARGTREYLTVIEGRVTVVSGDVSAELGSGMTARYPADVAHRISAEPSAPVRAFLVVKSG